MRISEASRVLACEGQSRVSNNYYTVLRSEFQVTKKIYYCTCYLVN